MYAVIQTGGKQYRVAKDDVIAVEKLAAESGEKIAFDKVLMVGGDGAAKVGAPLLDGAVVEGEVVEQRRADKIIVFKRKRRKGYRRTAGHRQHETVVRITEIVEAGGAKKATAKPKAKKADAAPAADAEAKPKAKAKPAAKSADADADAKPKAPAKPKAAAKPKAEATAKNEAKPKTKAKPAAKKADDETAEE